MPTFDQDVKPLFRDKDRREMTYAFDLWSYEDVKTHAQSILYRIEDGSMPCDAPWPDEQVQVLRDWIAGGFEP